MNEPLLVPLGEAIVGKSFPPITRASLSTSGSAKSKFLAFALAALALGAGAFSASAQLETAFTYQGRLADTRGTVDGQFDFIFALYDDAGTQMGTSLTNIAVSVTDGYFVQTLDFGPNSFRSYLIGPHQSVGPGEWLEISVRTNRSKTSYQTLAPRQRLTPTPYASTVTSALPSSALEGNYAGKVTFGNSSNVFLGKHYGDGSNLTNLNGSASGLWAVTGNTGTTAGTHFLGTTDNQPLELRVNGGRALRLEPNATSPNVIGGYSGNSVAAGLSGAVVSGGGSSSSPNSVTAAYGAVGGGLGNSSGADAATISGGRDNAVQVNSWYATIAGGAGNGIGTSARYSSIGGGYQNNIAADSWNATIAGGLGNGLGTNTDYSAIGGGYANTIALNAASAVIAGGFHNDIGTDADYSAVGGGQTNSASADFTTVAGGFYNRAEDNYASIGGGSGNRARGLYATVPGGRDNDAYGDYSFAAGRRARALGAGSFVWADNADLDFASGIANSNVFYVRASGGAKFFTGTNAFWTEADMSCATLTIRGGADLAEPFAMSGDPVQPGAVVVIDPDQPGRLKLSTSAYDHKVAGIMSGAGGVQPGISMIQTAKLEGGRNVALSGRVFALVDATQTPVRPGDLLTTSDTPGHAMRAANPALAQGSILGKAMTPLASGRGLVLVLVSLQ
jgi:hypothetical protein